MDNFDLLQRLGLAIAIGAAVGTERHWREREAPQGGRTAGIRTFTLIGMIGGLVGLIEGAVSVSPFPGLIVATFLLAIAAIMLRFGLREAEADKSHSATSVIAAVATFALGVLAALGDPVLASAGAAAMVAILASREFLHSAIRKLSWVELRSAVILLAMTFVLLPVIPAAPIGPFGGVSLRMLVVLVITLASISFAGYVAVRLLGPGRGDLVAGAVGGIVSSTATTLAFARRSVEAADVNSLAAGAIASGAVSLFRTALVVAALAPGLMYGLVPALVAATIGMSLFAYLHARREGDGSEMAYPANPFEMTAVVKFTLLIAGVAYLARAASLAFGDVGLFTVSILSALADVDASTVTVAGMVPQVGDVVATQAIGLAVIANMSAKCVYAGLAGSRVFALKVVIASAVSVGPGLAVWAAGGLV